MMKVAILPMTGMLALEIRLAVIVVTVVTVLQGYLNYSSYQAQAEDKPR